MSNFAHQDFPTGLRIAQTIGITASAYLFGQNASLSYMTMPAIMLAPAHIAAKQWASVLRTGEIAGPGVLVLSFLATGYVAYHQDPESLPFKLNTAATVLMASMVPASFAFIVPVNMKLFAKSRSVTETTVEEKSGETVHALIDKWATLNMARALVIGVGAVLTAWATVSTLPMVGGVGLKSGANRLG